MDETVKLKRKEGIMTADMKGSAVMLDIETGKYYNLGEVGGEIWMLLEKQKTVGELLDALTKSYNVSREQCRRDTLPFLEVLVKRGLLLRCR